MPRLRTHLRLVIVLALALVGLSTGGEWRAARAQSPSPGFLITPYYGRKAIRSYFDHEYPTYHGVPNNHGSGLAGDDNDIFTRYDGKRWTKDTSIQRCASGTNCYDGHNGYDFGLVYEPVLAAAAGAVVDLGWHNDMCHTCGYGLYVVLRHTRDDKMYTTRYAHLTSVTLQLNQTVHAGMVLGTSGSSGSSTGPHLHFDVRDESNRALDPFGWSGSQADPWAQYRYGAVSECLWGAGEWVSICDPAVPGEPLPPPPDGDQVILDDRSAYFSKGYGGLFMKPCSGTDPACRDWWDQAAGWGNPGHSLRSVSDGGSTADNWARWRFPMLPAYSALYEVFVWIPSIPGYSGNTFTWQAPYRVRDAAGRVFTSLVDEWTNSASYQPRDRWLSLGTYFLNNQSYVYTSDASLEVRNRHCPGGPGGWCRLAVDAIKLVRRGASYAPKLNRGGWSSTLVVHNNSGGSALAKISLFTDTGGYCQGYWWLLPGAGTFRVGPPSVCKGAVVDATQPVSILTLRAGPGGLDAENAFLEAHPNADPAFEQAAPRLFAPSVYHNFYAMTSRLYARNSGSQTTSLTLRFKGRAGYPDQTRVVGGVAPQGSYQLSLASVFGAARWAGSLQLDATQPMVLQLVETQTSDQATRVYNASAGGGAVLYVPAAYKNQWGLTSGLVVQNVHGSQTATVVLRFYDRDGTYRTTYHLGTLGPRRAAGLWFGGLGALGSAWSGTLRVDSLGGQPLVGVVQTAYTGKGLNSFSAAGRPGQVVFLPRAAKRASGLTSGYVVQNTGPAPLRVTAVYHDSQGRRVYSRQIQLPRFGAAGYSQVNDPLPDGWRGSVTLYADQPAMVAMGRVDRPDATGAYNGLSR